MDMMAVLAVGNRICWIVCRVEWPESGVVSGQTRQLMLIGGVAKGM